MADQNPATTIRRLGATRRQALDKADQALEEILRLAPNELEQGMSVKQLSELAAVSRPTLYARLGLSHRHRHRPS